MRIARLLGPLLAVLTVGGLLAPSAAAEPPFRLPSYVNDGANALSGSEFSDVQQAVDKLYNDRHIRLWVVYVDTFSGQDAVNWTQQTRRLSDIGGQDAILAVATQDRAYAFLPPTTAPGGVDVSTLRSNEIAVESERRSKAVLESQEQQLVADLHAKDASLAVAKINLGYTKIPAPADGTVGERQVRPGQLVSPGTQVLTFVPETKWVQANYRETQLTNMKVGDSVEIRVDQYPGKVFHGKVLEIAPASGSQFALLPPDNATGNFTKVVQRIPVKIAFDDANLASSLRPGLSVIATVRTRH